MQLGAKQDARKAALPKAELLEIEEETVASHELRETTVLTEKSANNVAVPFENPSLSDSDETDAPLFTITASPSQV